MLHRLRDLGNTVVVVEHDEDTIRAADWIIDLGPGAGRHGGEVVAEGTLDAILAAARSLTGAYLRGEREIPLPEQRATGGRGQSARGAGRQGHNLETWTRASRSGRSCASRG